MNLDTLEKQVLLWNRAAVLVPIFFTTLLGILFLFEILQIKILFFIACGLYFITAIIWWWWTMKSIQLLVNILKKTNQYIEEAAIELRNIRNDLPVDNTNDK